MLQMYVRVCVCVKFLLELVQVLEFREIKYIFMPNVNIIYNDNQACVNWST